MRRALLVFGVCAIVLGCIGLGQWPRAPDDVAPSEKTSPVAQTPARFQQTWRAELPRGRAAVPATASPNTPEPDPLATLLSLAAQPPSPERSAAIAAVVTEVGHTDTAGALDLAQALRSGMDDGTLEHRLQLWTEQAPAEAIAWVKSQPTGAARDRLLARAAYVRVQSNPAEALDLLQFMSADPANESATQAVLKLWQQRDPHGATAWLTQNRRSG